MRLRALFFGKVKQRREEKMKTILGTKVKMSQAFIGNRRVPATVVKAGPCVVTQVKNEKDDGYWALQIGFGERKVKGVTKPLQGHLKEVIKNKVAPRYLREVRFAAEPKAKRGEAITVGQIFAEGDTVRVSGIGKGKGFAGVVKRWGFAGGPKTHGQSDRQRAPGSIGQGTSPGRVRKGKKMAGRMGGKMVTVKNLKVIAVDEEKNEMMIAGPVPSVPGGLLVMRKIK